MKSFLLCCWWRKANPTNHNRKLKVLTTFHGFYKKLKIVIAAGDDDLLAEVNKKLKNYKKRSLQIDNDD